MRVHKKIKFMRTHIKTHENTHKDLILHAETHDVEIYADTHEGI